MRHLACLLWLAALLCSPLAALADSTSLLSQASAANPTRYQFAINKSAEIRSTSDNKAFTIWWQPAAGTPTGVLVTLHGHGSYATDEFYLWQPYLQARGYAILALQWWFGGGDTVADYYLPQDMYPIIASLLKEKGVKPGTVLLHGYSRGSANSYAVTAQDTSSGNRYINMTLSNSGGAAASFPPNQQIVAGSYGILPFSGIQWVMYCGELDPDPSINGCPAMTSAKTWVTQYGATVKLLMDDPSGGHGGFMANVTTALAQFAPAPRTPTATVDRGWPLQLGRKSVSAVLRPDRRRLADLDPLLLSPLHGHRQLPGQQGSRQPPVGSGPGTGGKLLELGPAAGFLGSAGSSAP